MEDSQRKLLRDVIDAQQTLHAAGSLPAAALAALLRHASERAISNSAETGCGATTLLLSHLSRNHTVFSLNVGGSVANVRGCPLLRGEVVTFVEGPSQRTLPVHRFAERLELVLIDGPHAYPFPDLEYYFFYPHLVLLCYKLLSSLRMSARVVYRRGDGGCPSQDPRSRTFINCSAPPS